MNHACRLTVVLLTLSLAELSSAQGLPAEQSSAASGGGTRRALLVCGLSGDAAHHKAFAETVTKAHEILTTKLGFGASDVEILFGDEPDAADTELIKSAARATREEFEKRVQNLRSRIRPQDSLWVITFGHSHYDGKNSWLNLPGPDIHQLDFAKAFADLPGQQIFILTTPTSGIYIKPLSSKNRIIITSTEADWETNETEFASELVRLLTSPPAAKELDVDQDGQITLFDLYISVARNLAQSYKDRELLATEHSLLDDNGDGRGTELQIDFLSTELGGRAKPGKPIVPTVSSTTDGNLAKSIVLSIGS